MLEPGPVGLAAAPARDLLAFCDAASADGLANLRTVLQRAEAPEIGYKLSPALLRRAGRSWVTLT